MNPEDPLRAAPLTILLIEDNPTDVLVISQILNSCGLGGDIRLAVDGEIALDLWKKIEAEQYAGKAGRCLVVLDLNLPKVSGHEILAHIRASPSGAAVPVLVVTSSSSHRDLAAIQALNASAYFRKPTDLDTFMELGNLIASILSASEKR
jgi:CheY-like chemotaxis protein